ncbi:MAG: CpXC domain-containing protein [Eubacteriales bacterium]|nr:CpXC domain-containing protein [Eubacteriales bacterium]
MAETRIVDLHSPYSGQIFERELPVSIVAHLDGELVEKLRSGELYTFQCPTHQRPFHAVWSMTYIDRDNALIAVVEPSVNPRDLPRIEVEGMRSRLMRRPEGLRELLLCLDYSFDDLALQIYKAMFIRALKFQYDEAKRKREDLRAYVSPDKIKDAYIYTKTLGEEQVQLVLGLFLNDGESVELDMDNTDFNQAMHVLQDMDLSNYAHDDSFPLYDWKFGQSCLDDLHAHGKL